MVEIGNALVPGSSAIVCVFDEDLVKQLPALTDAGGAPLALPAPQASSSANVSLTSEVHTMAMYDNLGMFL